MFKKGDNRNLWRENTTELKRENYILKTKLDQQKKLNNTLIKEKKYLEIQLINSKTTLKTYTSLPDDIDHLIGLISNVELKKMINEKLEKFFACSTCVVCHIRLKSVIYSGCNHLTCCTECDKTMDDKCPLCRKESKRVTLYL